MTNSLLTEVKDVLELA